MHKKKLQVDQLAQVLKASFSYGARAFNNLLISWPTKSILNKMTDHSFFPEDCVIVLELSYERCRMQIWIISYTMVILENLVPFFQEGAYKAKCCSTALYLVLVR